MSGHAPLYEQLIKNAALGNHSFHVPGHKNGRAYDEIPDWSGLLMLDMTEIPGLDDLHQAEGVIAEAQLLAAKLFTAEETFFLLNGSTVGNLALLLTVCAPGDLVIVQRNAHKSVFHGLMLAGARAVFVFPELDEQTQTATSVMPQTIKDAICQFPEAKAVFLTNPTYYGFSAELAEISEIVHDANMMLFVDEAHGAHFGFHPAWPRAAMQCGADGAVQSTHKMLAAMTMTGMLHVQGARLDRVRLRQVLAMLQSSSPSYVLMASLDLARARLEERGATAFAEYLKNAKHFQEWLAQDGLCSQRFRLIIKEPCKFILQMPGASGFQLQTWLADEACIVELADPLNVLLVLSIETTATDFHKLQQALTSIASRFSQSTTKMKNGGIIQIHLEKLQGMRPLAFAMTDFPSHADPIRLLPLSEAEGSISANFVTPYPPGIPILLPGETWQQTHVELIKTYIAQEAKVHGITFNENQYFVRVR
jgi:arginine decarboxylase